MAPSGDLVGSLASDEKTLFDLAKRGEVIAYFGYGSLVNAATHRTKILGTAKASVSGFKRHWQARPDAHEEPIALLSVHRSDATSEPLPGLLVFDHIDNLPSLDEREAGYDRVPLEKHELSVLHPAAAQVPTYIYMARPPHAPDEEHFILQSYLDAVLQGYDHVHGRDAVAQFYADTLNFHMPILQDRASPRYPRHVTLSDDARGHFDTVLRDTRKVPIS